MRARIVKINDKTVVIKGSNNKFATIAKSKFQFKYKLGDYIVVEKDGDKLYFLPDDEVPAAKPEKPEPHGHIDDSFLQEDEPQAETEPDDPDSNKPLIAAIASLGLSFVGLFVAFFICLGGGVAALVYSFSTLKPGNRNHNLIATLQVIAIVIWIAEFCFAMSAGGF